MDCRCISAAFYVPISNAVFVTRQTCVVRGPWIHGLAPVPVWWCLHL